MAGVEGVGAVLAEKEEPARQSGAAIDADHGLRANAPRPRAEQGMAALHAAQLDLFQNSRGPIDQLRRDEADAALVGAKALVPHDQRQRDLIEAEQPGPAAGDDVK